MALNSSSTGPLVAKLSNYAPLSDEERAVLHDAVSFTREASAGVDLVAEGASPDHSTLLIEGFSARYNLSMEGKRQITALHVSGDFVDLHSLLMKPMDHGIVALTACKLALVPHERLTRITEQYPRLARLLWLNTLIDGGTHRRWTFCLGSLQAHQHLAHLFCELYLRLGQIGRTNGNSFQIPLTQGLISECLAISAVHANRAAQMLRGSEMLAWERDLVTIRDWDRLAALAEFNPTYLRIPKSAI